jgi:hypothetical protein
MSTAQILAELPNLSPQELEAIYHRAEELLHGQAVSPEVLAAIDEADACPQSEDIPAEAVRQRVVQWARSK